MARAMMTLLGLAMLTAGTWLGWLWWGEAVLPVLKAVAVAVTLLAGVVVTVLGVSELAGARGEGRKEKGRREEGEGQSDE